MWKMLFPEVYSKYFDVPQTYKDEVGGTFYTGEMREFLTDLERIGGRKISDDDIRASIEVYNDNRRAINDLYALRAAEPWKAPASEAYLVVRAGLVLPVEEHTELVRDYIAAAKRRGTAPEGQFPRGADRHVLRTAAPEPDQVAGAVGLLHRR